MKDYFAAFRWGKIKEWLKEGGLFWTIYFMTLLPYIVGFTDKGADMILYYILMIPVGYCLVSENVHENVLPKLFYLCPMEKEQRKAYVERKFLFAIIVPAILGGVFAIILWAVRQCNPLVVIMYWVDIVFLGITTGPFLGKCRVPRSKGNNILNKSGYTRVGIEAGIMIISLFSIFGMGVMLCAETPVESWVVWVFVSVAVFVQLPLTMKHLSGWNKAVENAVGYAKTRL